MKQSTTEFQSNLTHKKDNRAILIRSIIIPILLLVGALVGGVVGFVVLENFSFVEALYMTIITVSTVGFGEIHELTDAGRIFTIILIVYSLGTFAYAASTISSFVLSGGISKIIKEYRNMEKIKHMDDHVIVAGYGRYGHEAYKALEKFGYNIIVIENDEAKVEDLKSRKVPCLCGDAAQDEILLEAGIKRAQAILVTLSDGAENVYVTLSARQLNPGIRLISRSADKRIQKKLRKAGANSVVMPEKSGGFHMATLVHNPNSLEFMELLSNMGVHFEDMGCDKMKTSFIGKKIKELSIRATTGVNIIGIRKENGEYIVNPGPDTVIQPSYHLILIGNNSQIKKFVERVS